MKSFQLIRHGETDWNREHIYQGRNDIPLNPLGKEQAVRRGRVMTLDGVSRIYTSPLLRARETAELVNSANGGTCNLIDVPEFVECSSEAAARYLFQLKGVKKLPSFEAVKEFEESPFAFLERVRRGLHRVLTEAEDEVPLIVAHGGVCAAICLNLNLPLVKTPNCALVDFRFENGKHKIHVDRLAE